MVIANRITSSEELSRSIAFSDFGVDMITIVEVEVRGAVRNLLTSPWWGFACYGASVVHEHAQVPGLKLHAHGLIDRDISRSDFGLSEVLIMYLSKLLGAIANWISTTSLSKIQILIKK